MQGVILRLQSSCGRSLDLSSYRHGLLHDAFESAELMSWPPADLWRNMQTPISDNAVPCNGEMNSSVSCGGIPIWMAGRGMGMD